MTTLPRWTPEELEILHQHYHHGDKHTQHALATAGYHRSLLSVTRARQRAQLSIPTSPTKPPPTPNHERVLNTLRDYHPCPLTNQDLQEETELSRAIVTTALNKAIKAGIVGTRLDPNADKPVNAPALFFMTEEPE